MHVGGTFVSVGISEAEAMCRLRRRCWLVDVRILRREVYADDRVRDRILEVTRDDVETAPQRRGL